MLSEESLVIYSDGGCLNNGNIGGWGMHGYFFTEDVPKQGSGCQKGSPTNNGYVTKEVQKEHSIPLVTLIRYVDGFGSLQDTTNNIAELTATINALKYVLEKKPKKVLLYSDSKYVVQGLNEWCLNWERNNWIKADGTQVANKEFWLELISIRDKVIETGIDLIIDWVKGHNGDVGNEAADVLATFGTTLAKKKMVYEEIKETDAKGYWSKTFEYNRIIDKSRWYFNSYNPAFYNPDMSRKPSGQWIYYLGNHGPDDELMGKPVSDSSFSVVYLKDPIKEMEIVRNFQNSINNKNFENVVIGRLDKILSADMLELINTYSDLLFEAHPYEKNIHVNKSLLTKEMNPPQLAYRATETLNNLEWILDAFIEDPAKNKLCVTDITNIFYGIESKGKKEICKLKSSIGSSTKKIVAKCQYDTESSSGDIDVPLLIGIDTPSRNALAALADKNPRFYVVTWKESDHAFHYATTLKTDEDIGIWAGVYSNLRLI